MSKKKSVVLEKPKKIIVRIEEDVYGREIWLAVGYTCADLNQLSKRKFNMQGDLPATCAEGSVHMLSVDETERKIFILRLSNFRFDIPYNGLLIHELHHLTHEVLEDAGMPYDQKNCEAYAYMIQSLFTKMTGPLAKFAGQHPECIQKSTNRK